MHLFTAALLAAATTSATTLAQHSGGINIDFNVALGAGGGQPSILFTGAAGQGGYWNPVGSLTPGIPVAIRNLANSADALTLSVSGTGAVGTFSANNAATTGDHELLMEDALSLQNTASRDFSLSSFAPGIYRIVAYGCAPDSAAYRTTFSFRTDDAPFFLPDVIVGGAMPANAWVEGVTHATFTHCNPVNTRFTLRATATTGFGTVNGLQVVRLNPTRLYVATASTSGDGLSWASPINHLQMALKVAAVTPSVTEIWVKRGLHTPDAYPNTTGDRTAEFLVPGGVSIIGGFAGTESSLTQRPDPTNPANRTILSGDNILSGGINMHRVVRCTPSASGATNLPVTLDRLTISDAFSDIDAGDPVIRGSAVYCTVGSLVMRECTVSGNTGFDAAVFIDTTLQSTISDCVIEGNTSHTASAFNADSSVLLERTTIRGNRVPLGILGDTVAITGGVSSMRNCLIEGNVTEPGGGWQFAVGVGRFGQGADLWIQNCTVANNTRGGGVYVTNAGGAQSTVRLNNTILWGNRRADASLTTEQQQLWIVGTDHTVVVQDCIIEGWSGTLAGPTSLNFSGDPQFVDADGPDNTPGNADDDYRLRPFSPARDSGWNGGISEFSLFDLDGNPRRIDDPAMPNSGFAGSNIDRGCYEMPNPSAGCAGDFGSTGGIPGPDGVRDNNDFVVFIDWFFAQDSRADVGRTGGTPGPDGLYNNNDFVAFIDLFFAPC